jgi:hypothetical protein
MRESRMTLKRMVILLAVMGLAVVILNPWMILYIALSFRDKNYWTSPGCTRTEQGALASPNGQVEAKVFHVSCGPVFVGNNVSDFLALTFVKQGDDPARYVAAMEVDLDDGKIKRVPWYPKMVWQSPSQLQVTLPEDIAVGIKKPPADVNIEVVRVPD